LHTYQQDGPVTEAEARALTVRGLIPLVWVRNTDCVRLLRFAARAALFAALSSAAFSQPRQERPPWAEEMLEAHNSVRTDLKLPLLVWSDKIAAVAQEWAETLLSRGQFLHRPNSSHGENLFEIDGGRTLPERVVGDWAAEARDYDYHMNACAGICGHYTQLVWRTTRQIGCGVAHDARREIWVCDYDPPGNVIGKKPY
jgi:pathogenesis-related protein 1